MAARLNVMLAVVQGRSIDDSWVVLKTKRSGEYAGKLIVETRDVITPAELEARANGTYKKVNKYE